MGKCPYQPLRLLFVKHSFFSRSNFNKIDYQFTNDQNIFLRAKQLIINTIIRTIISTNNGDIKMNNVITANELKTKGLSLIKAVTKNNSEAIISVRGKNEFVIIPIESYNKLRELELEAAIAETKKEIAEGKFVEESIAEHLKRVTNA